ncbi:MAG: hypothetical protein ACFBSE_00380 [Prochloraceae cyanobacterium]
MRANKIILLLFIFNLFFPIVARSNDKNNTILEPKFLLANKSNFLPAPSNWLLAKYYYNRANSYAKQDKLELALENYN